MEPDPFGLRDFCKCHPGFRPTQAEKDEAVEQYLLIVPGMKSFRTNGAPAFGHGSKPITPESARELLEFWATHLTFVERQMLDKISPRVFS